MAAPLFYHMATGKKVPVHPSMAKKPQWLQDNGFVKIEEPVAPTVKDETKQKAKTPAQ